MNMRAQDSYLCCICVIVLKVSGQDFYLLLREYQILDNHELLLLWVHLTFLSTCVSLTKFGLLVIIQEDAVTELTSVNISIVQRQKYSTLVLQFPNSGYSIMSLFGLPFKPD